MSSNTRNRSAGAGSTPHGLHPFKWMPRGINPVYFERIILLLSYVHFLATLCCTLLCIELLFFDSILAHETGLLSRVLMPIALAGVVNIPIHFWLRRFGIRKFHFLEHEARLDATHTLPPDSPAVRGSADITGEMSAMILAIDAAEGWDRQTARQAAKSWIIANRVRLDDNAMAYLRNRVGYLLPEEI